MGLLDQIFRTFLSLCCGSSAQQNAEQEEQKQQQPQAPQKEQNGWEQQKPHHHSSNGAAAHYQPQIEPSPPPHHAPSPPHHGPDSNQVNQQNPHYTALRKRARDAGDAMARCFEESHTAYAAGDGAGAKSLSDEGKGHKRTMEELNRQASEWIFIENNKDSKPGEIDLHGLFVKEAIEYTDKAIQDARQRNDTEIHLIVGKGLHSTNGVAKLKPAIEELMQKELLVAEVDPTNAGVLIVHIGGTGGIPQGREVGANDITQSLEKGQEGCLIM